jgi:inorganic pyrophosphatase
MNLANDSLNFPSSSEFWGCLDRLVAVHKLVIDRPKGSPHPRYPEYIYPQDYGYLEGTTSNDRAGVDVWRGTAAPDPSVRIISAVLLTVDLYKGDAEIKIVLDCTEQELQSILIFSNNGQMRAALVRRPLKMEAV